MNLKRIALLTASALAAFNPVAADEESDFVGTGLFTFSQSFGIGIDVFSTFVEGAQDIVATGLEDGFDIGTIFGQIIDLGVSVVGEIAAGVTNIAFALLTEQISDALQGVLDELDPFDATDILGDPERKFLVDEVSTDDCPVPFIVDFTIEEVEVRGISQTSIKKLVFLDNSYSDGTLDAQIDAKLGAFDANFVSSGLLFNMDCNDATATKAYTINVTVPQFEMGADFDLSALIDGSDFTANTLSFNSVSLERSPEKVVANAPPSKEDKVKNALVAHFKKIIIEEVVLEIEESSKNVTLLDELIAEYEIMPQSIELPFEWPL